MKLDDTQNLWRSQESLRISSMDAVIKYGAKIGSDRLAPHDLRRTFAKLAHTGHAALEPIQLSLGYASRYRTVPGLLWSGSDGRAPVTTLAYG